MMETKWPLAVAKQLVNVKTNLGLDLALLNQEFLRKITPQSDDSYR